MRSNRQNLRSTKPRSATNNSVMTTSHPTDVRANNLVSFKVVEITGKIYTDQTGKFPITSSRGNKYIMVLYDHDTNAILVEAIKNRPDQEIIRAQTKLHDYCTDRGYTPKVQILDNECPAVLKKHVATRNIVFQLVPPHLHCTNSAERAIATFKDHFIAGLSSTDPSFPMHLWCRRLPLATTTLNLLRPSRLHPKISAEAALNGAFDYNKTPIAPPGTKVVAYKTPSVRQT